MIYQDAMSNATNTNKANVVNSALRVCMIGLNRKWELD
jgi:hypothetical protein